VIAAAASAGVRSVVCLSTDKAVYPVNAMGMSKGLMEDGDVRAEQSELQHRGIDHALLQRHVFPWFGDPAVC
jgi:FlaA1/EpsC-like NDP-sugar epimerase